MIINKINLNKWLNTENKYTNTKIIDLIQVLFEYLYTYIDNNDELELQTDKNTFYKYFVNFIYNEHVYPIKKIQYICSDKILDEEYFDDEQFVLEYFECKFSEDILDIYLHFKYLIKNYNFNLFNHKNDTSYPLLLFVFYNCNINTPYIDDETLNLEENIMIYE